MGFFNRIGKALNIHGTEVHVVVEDDIYSQGDQIKGRVIVRGGDYDQSGQSLFLELIEFWTEIRHRSSGGNSYATTVTVSKVRQKVQLVENILIPKHTEKSFDFELQLPRNCRITVDEARDEMGWQLGVTLDIPKVIDPVEYIDLRVQPAEEFLAVIRACEQGMRFQKKNGFLSWGKSKVAIHLLPPKVLQSEIDALDIELSLNKNGSLVGSLVFDLQEKSILDYFKAIISADLVKKTIELSPSQIFLSSGDINVAAITKSIGQLLQEVIHERTQSK